MITDEVMERIEALAEFAPLHNPANLMGITAFKKILPDIISVAVFDTSFRNHAKTQLLVQSAIGLLQRL